MDLHKNVYNDCIMLALYISAARPWRRETFLTSTDARKLVGTCLHIFLTRLLSFLPLPTWRGSKNESLESFQYILSSDGNSNGNSREIDSRNFSREIRFSSPQLWKNSHRFFRSIRHEQYYAITLSCLVSFSPYECWTNDSSIANVRSNRGLARLFSQNSLLL